MVTFMVLWHGVDMQLAAVGNIAAVLSLCMFNWMKSVSQRHTIFIRKIFIY